MPKGTPGSWQHGTNSGYQCGCRLECCKAAHREYNAERRQRNLPKSPGRLEFANREAPHARRAKGKTLEELLAEW